jgi:AcrR family transcriptional regulator
MQRGAGMRKRRTQEERSATTRRELVRAAADSIAALGLNRATITVIAAKAGVTSGAIQHHFASRDELLLSVVEEFGRALADDRATHTGSDGPVSLRVQSIVQRYWSLFGSRQYLAVMKIWLGTDDSTPLYREITGQMRWFEKRFDREWVELFSDCGATPESIANARHVALAAMRGLALSLSFTKDRARTATEVALLEEMVTRALEGERTV